MKPVLKVCFLILSLIISISCKPKDNTSPEAAREGNPSLGLNLPKKPVELVGEYLARIANTQYDIVDGNQIFAIGDKPITLAVEGCPRSFFQLKKYSPDAKDADPSLSAKDYEDWNRRAEERNREVLDTLEKALETSSCAFKDGQMRKAFPEFFAFDEFWSKTYDEKGFLTDEEYEEISKSQPALIDQAEFLKRVGCLKDFQLKPVPRSPVVCTLDRFEGSSKTKE